MNIAEEQSRTMGKREEKSKGARNGLSRFWPLGVAALLAASCSPSSAVNAQGFKVRVRVASDPGKAVEGAKLHVGAQIVASTDVDGTALFEFDGEPGELVGVRVACPQGLVSPKRPIEVLLRPLSEPGAIPEYQASCPPSHRTIVVAIRAKNGANLPVMHLGREVARTDAFGAAHVVLEVRPGTQFRLGLDTSAASDLRPRSPVGVFRVPAQDDLFVFEQSFVEEEKSAPRRKRRARQHRATRI